MADDRAVSAEARAPHAVAGVVLAAGQGARLGGRPKCLLRLDGMPLLQRVVAALTGAGLAELVVVTGHHAGQVEPLLAALPVRCVRNPQPQEGQVSSLRLGLAALATPAPAVIVALADQPLLTAADVADLLDAWRRRPQGTDVVFPLVDGERGNPVIFSAVVRDAVLAGGPDFGARQWQDAHPERVAPLVSDNRRYRIDIDTAADLARFARDTGQVLRWPQPG